MRERRVRTTQTAQDRAVGDRVFRGRIRAGPGARSRRPAFRMARLDRARVDRRRGDRLRDHARARVVPRRARSAARDRYRGAGRRDSVAIGGASVWRVARPVADAGPRTVEAAPVSPPDLRSIAVLPLVNTSGDPGNEYFSDGLSEELISVLARIPDLKIIGRTSSFRFKNTNDDSRTIGAMLGVANLLEGSVRKQGERVRIAVDLIAAADGRQLWSETYDRDLSDIFAVQSEIAGAVVAQLKLKLLGASTVLAATREPSLPAYTALLQGAHLLPNFNETDLRQSIVYFEEATRLDPEYALAYARLAAAWRSLAALYLSERDAIADAYRKAGEACRHGAAARSQSQRSAYRARLSEAHVDIRSGGRRGRFSPRGRARAERLQADRWPRLPARRRGPSRRSRGDRAPRDRARTAVDHAVAQLRAHSASHRAGSTKPRRTCARRSRCSPRCRMRMRT